MRLWHYELIPFLPNKQLIAQWKELNAIFKNQDKHILINYVYMYPISDLYIYSIKIIREMEKREIRVKSYRNLICYCDYNLIEDLKSGYAYNVVMHMPVFKNHHNYRYLKQCFYNLQEKYDRGQDDFSKEIYHKLERFVQGYLRKDKSE